jgi:hypothetical protein
MGGTDRPFSLFHFVTFFHRLNGLIWLQNCEQIVNWLKNNFLKNYLTFIINHGIIYMYSKGIQKGFDLLWEH